MLLKNFTINLDKTDKKRSIYVSEHLKLINNGEIKKLRNIIRLCVIFEASEVTKKFAGDLKHPLLHFEFQLVASTANNLLFNNDLVKSLIRSNIRKRNLVYPLSKQWINLFIEGGIPVIRYRCLLKFYIHCAIKLIKNHIKSFLLVAKRRNKLFEFEANSSLIYSDTKELNLSSAVCNNLNFVNWLKNNNIIDLNSKKLHFLRSKSSVQSTDLSIYDVIRFNLKITLIESLRFIRDYRFKFIKFFLVSPNLILEYFNLRHDVMKNISKLIIPSSQGWIKSSWMLRLEESGAKVIYVNLSDSSEPSVTFDCNFPVTWYSFSQWRTVTVCSENQRLDFSSQCPKFYKPSIDLLGVPDWIDSGNLRFGNDKYISVFDFEPQRDNYGYSCNNDSGYSDLRNTLKFIDSISELAQELRIHFIYKSKRPISNSRRYPSYSNSLKIHSNNEFFHVADEQISPRKIIRNSIASINMPFSSTALIARELSIPTCFYDIVGRISTEDPGSNGILIINRKLVLADWLIKQISSDSSTKIS